VSCRLVERLPERELSRRQKVIESLIVLLGVVTFGQLLLPSPFAPRCGNCDKLMSLNYWRGIRLVEPSEPGGSSSDEHRR
jgi:hypothetical protein